MTPYQGRNPNFRVFKYDRTTHEILDFMHYRFDLDESNKERKPIWFQGYSMKQEYQLDDMSALSFQKMVFKMQSDQQLWNKYKYNYRGGWNNGNYNLERNATLCHLLTAIDDEYNYCISHLYPSQMKSDEWHSAIV